MNGGTITLQPFTALGWNVADVRAVLARLADKGVIRERFGSTRMQQTSGALLVVRESRGSSILTDTWDAELTVIQSLQTSGLHGNHSCVSPSY